MSLVQIQPDPPFPALTALVGAPAASEDCRRYTAESRAGAAGSFYPSRPQRRGSSSFGVMSSKRASTILARGPSE